MQTRIAHVDLDCFFVSVERIFDPSLRGKPVVVGGSPTGRGVVASASYEARKFGIHSAMPTARALRLCPHLIVVKGNHKAYSDYSHRLTALLRDVAPVVERVSIDEMNLDLSGCEELYGPDWMGFLLSLKERIRKTFGLPATLAIASNKTLAKIAANTVKPDGCIVIPPGGEEPFLAPLSVEVIPGVGKKTAEALFGKGFRTIAQLQPIAERDLIAMFGALGGWLHRIIHGGGSVSVVPERTRKSVSKEETFAKDIGDLPELESRLYGMVEAICYLLRKKGETATTVTLKMRYADFTTVTRQQRCAPTDIDPVIFGIARALLRAHYRKGRPLRLLGVGVSGLGEGAEPELPLGEGNGIQAAVRAADALRKKFGEDIIHYAGSQ